MTQFNKQTNTIKTTNHEDAPAYTLSRELELYTLVVTSNFSNKFYEDNDIRLERMRKLIAQTKPEFVAKLAIYAREEMYLRTIPLVLAVELAKTHNGDNLVSTLVERIVKRADEITELLGYYALANDRDDVKKLGKLSKQIQKGLSKAFNNFDEYQFAKYNRSGAITLKDALFIVHPTAKDISQQELFNKIAEDTLKTPYTWETELSEKGNTAEAWIGLIDSKKLPYMAALRNLRNMLNAKVPFAKLNDVVNYLTNETAIRNSKQFPFRYLSAYKELKGMVSPEVMLLLQGLEDAVKQTASNIPMFSPEETVAIACDVSGSMFTYISPKSKVMNYDIGLVLGMLLQNRCSRVVTSFFGDDNKIVALPKDNILSNVMELKDREGEVGYSTNGYKVLDSLRKNDIKADKIMMFTDCQMWDSHYTTSMVDYWKEYKEFYPDAKLFLFDLDGYGTTPVQTQDNDSVYLISGWSDRVFNMIAAYERKETAISEIENIVL